MIGLSAFEQPQQLIDIVVLSLLNRPEMSEGLAQFDAFPCQFLVFLLQLVKAKPQLMVLA
jgi:hypothetical protein